MEAAAANFTAEVHITEHDQSTDLGALAKALAAAQGEMQPALKDSTNPDYASTYATLASVIDACRAPLSKHGIAWLQRVSTRPGFVAVTTQLVHESGQWVRDRAELAVTAKNAQAAGSAITYLRRYMLSALVGVACEDDDGAAASQPAGEEKEQRREARRADGAKAADPKVARIAKLWKAAQAKGMTEERFKSWLVEVLGAEKTSDELTPKEVLHLERALRDLEKTASAKQEGPNDGAH